MEYQKYEYCKAVNCDNIDMGLPGKKSICAECEAYQFHKYLHTQGYKIIKASRLSCIEEGNKAMTAVLTKMANFLDVEQGNVEDLLEAIEDLKERAE